MQRTIYLIVALILLSWTPGFAQISSGTLQGKVTDKETKEPLSFVNVIVFLNGNLVTGGATDIDGKYSIKPIEPGTYDIQFQFVGYQTQTISGVPISAGKIGFVDAALTSGVEMTTIEIVDYKVPLIDKDGGASGGTVTREEIAKMPSRDALGLAQTVAGVSSAGTGGGISIRGARTNSTWVYIDGIKVRGSSNLPKSAIEEVSVITGGIPANIGDATGGVINISLRSASSKYTGGFEVITSGFKSGDGAVGLDSYGYNLVEGSISGPLLFKKKDGVKDRPLVGFFLSGNYTDRVDPNAYYGGVYRMKQETMDALLTNPLRLNIQDDGSINGALYNADFLTSDDFEKIKTRQNVRSRQANMVAKIDVNTSETVTLTFGGTAAFNRGNDFNYNNMLMNWDNNLLNNNFDWRAYAKFSQRFKNSEDESASSNLRNVFYSIMADYSQARSKTEDQTHGDSFFRYGHVGYFDIQRYRSYSVSSTNPLTYDQNGWQNVNVNFTPSEYNPDLSAVTNQYYNLFSPNEAALAVLDGSNALIDGAEGALIGLSPTSSLNAIQLGNGLINGQSLPQTYGLWNYIGSQANDAGEGSSRYSQFINSQFRISGTGSADIGDHAIQVGFEFEQRNDAGYSVSPVSLWTLARQYANFHNSEIDFDNPNPSIVDNPGVANDYTVINYDNAVTESDIREFAYRLRESMGLNPYDQAFINIDNMNPDDLSIDMFGADDLLNQGNSLVEYYGFTAQGKRLTGSRPTIEDFFSGTYKLGDNTYYSRNIGSFQPVYISGYLMDKFAFDDLIFNVGLRIDRYDANQYVPKDPFVIGEALTASEVNFGDFNANRPSNIGDDFVVYVDDIRNPGAITGYRDGNTWYNASGQEVTDPFTSIASGGKVNPLLKNGVDAPLTSSAFREYTPAVNFMPRVAFSFPISDEALFFAHYDILTQRPTGSNRFNPADYLYMENRNLLIDNPDLRPEKTVDYALGFQQVLSRTSSLKVEAFYRELRDMIQVRSFAGAYPSTYRAFGNLDFGTVKGLTLTYDLRRTGNLWLKASYTLQFADGTGSTTQSQLALINAGLPNLRSVNAFNYDQRHRIVGTVDYRFGEGSDYNGPMIGDKAILKNTGINFIANLGSGTPYTPQVFATPITGEISPATEGSINGARLPWSFTVDLNLDRNIALTFGKTEDKKKTANLNVYLWVTNLFNTRNIVGVHRFTGNPDDDGYLAAARYQPFINQQNDPSAFRNYYSMYVNDPRNLGAPRQLRLGVRFDF